MDLQDGMTYEHPALPGRDGRTCTYRDDVREWWYEVPLTRDYTGDANPHGPARCQWPHLLRTRLGGLNPPIGWYHFGTHAGWEGLALEFSEEKDEALMPLWERPVMNVALIDILLRGLTLVDDEDPSKGLTYCDDVSPLDVLDALGVPRNHPTLLAAYVVHSR